MQKNVRNRTRRDEPSEKSKQWEKIAQLCELNHKDDKDAKDRTRMRTILLEKKNETNKWVRFEVFALAKMSLLQI